MEEESEAAKEKVESRIRKDIEMFDESVKEYTAMQITPSAKEKEIAALAAMYASDAKSYLKKGDLFTAFSCISYAHGLLDALKALTRE
ncbi:MAG: DUF357 domain-containing protein [Candidatus Micrarchaeaceae archaeon]